MSQTDVIDYKIGGGDIQYVEIELDPGESVVSEAGAMMYKSPSVGMDAVFGDGSSNQSGVWGALAGAGIQFAVTAALCTAAGWWLDGRLGSSPWLLMAGGIVGAVGAFYRLYRTLIDVAAGGDEPVEEE